MPEVLRSSIIVSHFGFRAAQRLWVDSAAWEAARSMDSWLEAPWGNVEALQPACFQREKDIVVPVDFAVSPSERANQIKLLEFECASGGSMKSRDLIYMAGSMRIRYASFYSQGVRAYFHQLHRETPGVRFELGNWTVSAMSNATFCLAPSGWGFGWRAYISLSMLCIPVIVQPLVDQAFQDNLPYSRFSLRFSPSDIPTLPQRLRKIAQNRSRVCALRRAAARYARALMWEPPGIAYHMLQVSLCQRALIRILRVQEATMRGERARRQSLPAWHKCALMTAKHLMKAHAADQRSTWPAIRPPPYNQKPS